MIISTALVCMALNIYWEARGQDLAGQLAVAQVTLNRVASKKYPDDVCAVVYQHKQFSWYSDGESDIPKDLPAWNTARLVASAALAGSGHVELEGVTHYHAEYVSPYWSLEYDFVTQIQEHKFYRISYEW